VGKEGRKQESSRVGESELTSVTFSPVSAEVSKKGMRSRSASRNPSSFDTTRVYPRSQQFPTSTAGSSDEFLLVKISRYNLKEMRQKQKETKKDKKIICFVVVFRASQRCKYQQ